MAGQEHFKWGREHTAIAIGIPLMAIGFLSLFNVPDPIINSEVNIKLLEMSNILQSIAPQTGIPRTMDSPHAMYKVITGYMGVFGFTLFTTAGANLIKDFFRKKR